MPARRIYVIVVVLLVGIAGAVYFRETRDTALPKLWSVRQPGADLLSFTPEGRHLLGLSHGQVLVWNAQTGRPVPDRFQDALYGPRNDPIARPRAVFAGNSSVWCLEPGRSVVFREIPSGAVQTRWELPENVALQQADGDYRVGPSPVTGGPLLASPDFQWLATGRGPVNLGAAPELVLLDARTGREQAQFDWGPCAFSRDTRYFVVAESQPDRRRLVAWDIPRQAEAGEFLLPEPGMIRAIQALANGQFVVSRRATKEEALGVGFLEVWDAAYGRQVARLQLPRPATQLSVHREGHTILAHLWNDLRPSTELVIWDGQELHHRASPRAASLAEEAPRIAGYKLRRDDDPVLRTSPTVNVLSLPELELVRSFPNVLSTENALPFLTADGRLLLVMENATEWSTWSNADVTEHCLSVYRIADGACLARMRRFESFGLDAHGSRRVEASGNLPALRTLLLARDSRHMATIAQDGQVTMWTLPE